MPHSYVGLVHALLGSILPGQLNCKCAVEIPPSRHIWVVSVYGSIDSAKKKATLTWL